MDIENVANFFGNHRQKKIVLSCGVAMMRTAWGMIFICEKQSKLLIKTFFRHNNQTYYVAPILSRLQGKGK
jgi:hypothetical protein